MNQYYVGRIVSIYQWKRLMNENLKFDTWRVMIFEIFQKSPRVYRSYHGNLQWFMCTYQVDFNTGCNIIQVGHFIPIHVILLITCLNLHTCTQHWDNIGYEPISGGTKQPQIEYCVDGMMRNCSRWLRSLSIMHMNVGLYD